MEFQLDVTIFGQCLSAFSTKIAERTEEFEKFIVEDAITSLAKVRFYVINLSCGFLNFMQIAELWSIFTTLFLHEWLIYLQCSLFI